MSISIYCKKKTLHPSQYGEESMTSRSQKYLLAFFLTVLVSVKFCLKEKTSLHVDESPHRVLRFPSLEKYEEHLRLLLLVFNIWTKEHSLDRGIFGLNMVAMVIIMREIFFCKDRKTGKTWLAATCCVPCTANYAMGDLIHGSVGLIS